MANIMTAAPPSISMSLKLGVSLGRNQIQRNTGNYSAIYLADGQQVTESMMDLEVNETWASGAVNIACLVLSVTSEVTVTLIKPDASTVVLAVKRLLVLDQNIIGFSILNSGTAEVRASINYVTYTP